MRLSQEQPSDEDEISQNSIGCEDGHRAAMQEKDTVHVKRCRSVIQFSRSHRGTHRAKLLRCLCASVEGRDAKDGEMQTGGGFAK